MKVEFLGKFNKDLDHLKQPKDKAAVLKAIMAIKDARTLTDIPHLKKLQGFQNAYRVRCGDLRIGIFVEKDVAQFARVRHRKDIYSYFP